MRQSWPLQETTPRSPTVSTITSKVNAPRVWLKRCALALCVIAVCGSLWGCDPSAAPQPTIESPKAARAAQETQTGPGAPDDQGKPGDSGKATPPSEGDAHGEEIELAVLMLRMQTHAGKLHFAAEANNWPLTNFYLHELEEAMEEIEAAHIVEDGHKVSEMAGRFLKPPLEGMEAAAKASDAKDFGLQYDTLVTACNGCHKATEHGFIVIQRPSAPIWTHQRFTP